MAQQNIFYAQPDKVVCQSPIVQIRVFGSAQALAVETNIARASGGGEPQDRGWVTGPEGDKVPILDLEKADGMTWLIARTSFEAGQRVTVELDKEYRLNRRKLHSAIHLCIRAALNHFEKFRVLEAEVSDCAQFARIKAAVDADVLSSDIARIDASMRSEVLSDKPIFFSRAKSIEHAEQEYGSLFRVSDKNAFRGKVRLVCIEDFDVNPCSGLHHSSSNIGPYEMHVSKSTEKSVFDVSINLVPTWTYWYGD